MSFNQSFFEVISGVSGKSVALDAIGVFFAEYFSYLIVITFFLFWFSERNWKIRFSKFSFAALSLILSRGIIVSAIRFFYFRPRPGSVLDVETLISLPSSSSFPSGHATFFFALAASVFLVDRKWGLWFFLGAFLVGLARVFVGVHWPLDIVGGAVIGIGSALIVRRFLPKAE